MPTWVCLLRAVNLGNHNKVNMARLRESLADAGFGDVRTYVQSGNVVLASSARSPRTVSTAVRGCCARRSRSTPRCWCARPRSCARWPSGTRSATSPAERPTSVHVLHLDAEPDPEALAALLGTDWGADRVAARGLEVVIAYGESMHDSRLQHAALLKRLAVTGTARNWRTLLALVDLA